MSIVLLLNIHLFYNHSKRKNALTYCIFFRRYRNIQNEHFEVSNQESVPLNRNANCIYVLNSNSDIFFYK